MISSATSASSTGTRSVSHLTLLLQSRASYVLGFSHVLRSSLCAALTSIASGNGSPTATGNGNGNGIGDGNPSATDNGNGSGNGEWSRITTVSELEAVLMGFLRR